MAVDTKVEAGPAEDHAAAEAAGGGGGGASGAGGPDFLNETGVLGVQGLAAPSFTVVAADMNNTSFKVLRPQVIVAGVGPVAVASRTFTFGDEVWCIVKRTKSESESESDDAYTYTAELETSEDGDAYLAVKVAEIPAKTAALSCGGVLQYHVGAILVGQEDSDSDSGMDVVTGIDIKTEDNKVQLVYTTQKCKKIKPVGDPEEHKKTVVKGTSLKYVTSVIYKPAELAMKYNWQRKKLVICGDESSSSSSLVFEAKPACMEEE